MYQPIGPKTAESVTSITVLPKKGLERWLSGGKASQYQHEDLSLIMFKKKKNLVQRHTFGFPELGM